MSEIAIEACLTAKRFDSGPGQAGRVGLVVLADDPVAESEVAASFRASQVSLHVTRMQTPPNYRHDTLETMGPAVLDALGSILPADRINTVALCCSALAASIGREKLATMVANARPGVTLTDPGQASVQVMRSLGAKKISLLLTPSDESVNKAAARYYASHGFTIVKAASLGLANDLEMSTLSHASIGGALAEVADAKADVILVPCTAMRTWEVASRVDPKVGNRILTGNRALALHSQALAARRSLSEIVGSLHGQPL